MEKNVTFKIEQETKDISLSNLRMQSAFIYEF